MMKNRNRHTILFIFFALIVVLLFRNRAYSIEQQDIFNEVTSIDYQEDITTFHNPERGFYNPVGYRLKQQGNSPINPSGNLVHLRVGLGEFSSNGSGQVDSLITEDALNALIATLNNIRKNNASVIIRFAYDDFNGAGNKEPSMEMILKHIEQLGPVLEANRDVVSLIEIGFFGPWGELHTSSIGVKENVALAIDKMLAATNQKMKISVRTPGHYAVWRNLDIKTINTDITTKGTKEYQVGIFNDGYLGSESDLGTFANRKVEVEWLSNQAKHTFYGGEMVANSASGTPLNTIEYIQNEAFVTHTTYLNSSWNYEVINGFKTTPYKGEDSLYKDATAYQYIDNHLGYRYVLRKSSLTNNIEKTDLLKFKLEIENVGFANLINDKQVSIVLENEHDIYEIKTLLDPTTWDSSSITKEDFYIGLPGSIEAGDYNVYLRISEHANLLTDSNYHCIRFANKDIYKQEIGANYIGKVTITEQVDIPDKPSTGDDDKNDNNNNNENKPSTNPDNNNSSNNNNNGNTQPPSNNTNSSGNSQTSSNKTTPKVPSTSQNTTSKQQTTTNNTTNLNRDYKIEYYYDGVIDKTKTIVLQGEKDSIIDSYMDKIKENYVLEKIDNFPLKITDNVDLNIMRIYYVLEEKSYQDKELNFSVTKEVEEKTNINLFIFVGLGLVTLLLLLASMKFLFKKPHKDKTNKK